MDKKHLLFSVLLPCSLSLATFQQANIPQRLDFRCTVKISDTDSASRLLVDKVFLSRYHDGAVGEQTTVDAVVRIHDADWDLGINSRWNKQGISFVRPGGPAGALVESYESRFAVIPGASFNLTVQPPQGGNASFSSLQVNCVSNKR